MHRFPIPLGRSLHRRLVQSIPRCPPCRPALGVSIRRGSSKKIEDRFRQRSFPTSILAAPIRSAESSLSIGRVPHSIPASMNEEHSS